MTDEQVEEDEDSAESKLNYVTCEGADITIDSHVDFYEGRRVWPCANRRIMQWREVAATCTRHPDPRR